MFKIGVYGDMHAGYDGSLGGVPSVEVYSVICGRFTDAGVNAVIPLGDLVHNTAEGKWEAWEAHAEVMREMFALWPMQGNHDDAEGFVAATNGKIPENGPTFGEYSVLAGNIVVVAMNISTGGEKPPNCPSRSQQITWLDRVLTTYKTKPVKIVCWHRPPYTTGMRGSDVCSRCFDAVIHKHKVSLVLCGHTHAFEDFLVNGTPYLVTGGAGGFPHTLDTGPETRQILKLRRVGVETYNYGVISVDTTLARVTTSVDFYDLDGVSIDSFGFSVVSGQRATVSKFKDAVEQAPQE